MTEHIITAFEDELETLANNISKMGKLAGKQFANSMDSLRNIDMDLAKKTVASDRKIDKLEFEIEELAILMIARRQPMALDLREIVVAIRIASDLERVGDLGKNIAKRAMAISSKIKEGFLHSLDRMEHLTMNQLKKVLIAHAARDADKALEVWRSDGEIDECYNSLFRELLTYMMENPYNIGICTHLLFVAKNIERIGDHTTNIAENIYYMVKGEPLTDKRPKGDITSSTNTQDLQ